MPTTAVLFGFYAGVAALVVTVRVMNDHVRPRRRRRDLVNGLARELAMSATSGDRGETILSGSYAGTALSIAISREGFAVLSVPLSRRAVPHELSICETSSWSYQKTENRLLGLTVGCIDDTEPSTAVWPLFFVTWPIASSWSARAYGSGLSSTP